MEIVRMIILRNCIFGIADAMFCLLITCSMSGCKQNAKDADLGSETEAIRVLDASWVRAGQSKDVDAWVAFYANDAAVLPPNEPVATNREAIRRSVSELLTLPGLSIDWKPAKIEVARSGELAYLYGAYSLAWDDADKRATDQGKIVEIWKKQPDGLWKCVVDTWNSDLPPTPPSAKSGH
jgi:ketosteroid isomerase-like protein